MEISNEYYMGVYDDILFTLEADAWIWRGAAEFKHMTLEQREQFFNECIVPVVQHYGAPAKYTQERMDMMHQVRATIAGKTVAGFEPFTN